MIKNKFILQFILAIVVILPNSIITQKNFVVNPTLDGDGAFPTGWAKSGTCEIDKTNFQSGTQSVHCTGPGGFYQINKSFFHGVYYKATAIIKTKNIQNGRVLFYVESANYIYGVYLYSNSIPECAEGTCDDKWYTLSGTSVMIFNKASHYQIGFSLRPKEATGEYWIDEVKVEVVERDVLKSVDVRSWKSEVYKDPFEIIVDLDIVDSVFSDGSYLDIDAYIEDPDNSSITYDHLTDYVFEDVIENRIAVFKYDPINLEEDKYYKIRVVTVNSLFSNRTEEKYTIFKKLNATRNLTFYVDKNNIAWLNGKKFFPIGLYFQYNSDPKDLEKLKNSPINLIKCPGWSAAEMDKFFNATGRKVYILNNLNAKLSNSTDKESLLKVRESAISQINKFKSAEGLIGYYVADEPGLYNTIITNIRETTLAIREYDPNRIAWAALLQTKYCNRWKEMIDVAGIDCYPVQHYEELQDIWVVTLRARNSMMNNRPIWGIPQFFTWEIYTNDTSERPPTEDQLRQMTYQFIVAGANGVIYYDFHEMKTSDPKYPFEKEWAKMLKVTKELSEKYVDIILSLTPVNPYYNLTPTNYESGSNYYGRRLFRYRKFDYLLIVNVRNKAYNITFKKPNTTDHLQMLMGKAKMHVNKTSHVVTLQMPAADTIWLRGYDVKWNPKEEDVSNFIRVKLTLMIICLLLALI